MWPSRSTTFKMLGICLALATIITMTRATEPCPDVTCENKGTLNATTCECSCLYPYTGDTCEEKNCTGQLDAGYCTDWPLNWPVGYCDEFPDNVLPQCPILCGTCPGPCNGKQCQNGGGLDPDTCQCSCFSAWEGDTCEIKNCTGAVDESYCSYLEDSYCGPDRPYRYYIRPRCPMFCGDCPGTDEK